MIPVNFYLLSLLHFISLIPLSNTVSVWQCYGEKNPCGWTNQREPYDVIGDPQLSQGDIPQLLQGDESSTSIEVSNLAGKILLNKEKFGLLILESGNSSIVQWKCGTTPLPLPVYFSNQSTLVSAFTSALPFYHFDFSFYNGDPQKVLLFPPNSLLSFSTSSSSFDVSSSCLIFAFILWDPSLVPLEDDTQPVAFNVSQCSNCASLPLTNQAFRLCPSVSSESVSFTSPTESTSSSVSTQDYHPNGVKVIEPSIVDSNVESKVMMELQNPVDPKDMRGCKILSKTREIDIELDTKDVSSTRFTLTVPAGVQPDNYYVLCSVDNADWSAHNWSLSVFDFRELIQLKDYSVEETQKAVIPRFIQPLPSQFSQDFYCQDDSGRYESLNASSLVCSIRENSNRIWFVRSLLLADSTLKYQNGFVISTTKSPSITQSTTKPREEDDTSITIRFDTTPPAQSTTQLTTAATQLSSTSQSSSSSSSTSTSMTTSQPRATVPTQTVRPSTSSPQIRSTLPSRDSCFARFNDDLLGLSLEATDGCFPEGIFNCSSLINVAHKFGDSSICMGDSNSASVAFGSFPSLLPHSSITIKCLKSCKTTVEEPLNPIAPSFAVKHPEKTLSCGNAVFDIRQVLGDGRQSMQYQWKIRGSVDGLDPQLVNLISSFESRNLSIPCSWITRSLSLQVTACNFVSRCTTSNPLSISPSSSASLLSVSISGLPSSVPYPSLPLVLTAEAVFYMCNGTFLPNDMRFNWFINGNLTDTSRQLVIPEFSYASFDLLAIRLTAEYQDENNASAHLKAEDERTITFGQMPLIGSVDCSYWTVAEEMELKVDGSSSRNPNDREGSVKHEWSCIEQRTREDICKQEAVNTHSAILRIPKGTLKANMIVNVSDVVTASNLSASSNCIISVVSEQIPQVDFQQLADTKINIDDYARINGIVERAICPLEVTWSVVTDNEITDFFDISQFLSSASTTFNNLSNMDVLVSLTIPPYLPELYPKWTGLQAGRKYRIRLSAKSPKGKSYSDIILTTNSPPQIGIIDISPFPPVSLSSPIVLSAGDGWTDPDLPLSYRFSVITYFGDNSTSTSSFPRSSTSFQTVFLPSADSSSQRDSYMVSLSVCDRYSSCSSSFSSPFTVLPPQNVSLAAQHLLTSINADVSNGNMLDAVDKVVVINEEINKMTIDMDTADRLVQMLLDTINNRSESILYVRVLDSSMKMLDIISPNTVSKITKAVDAYRLMKGGTQLKKKGDRQKRDDGSTDSGGSPNQVSTQDAHDMLRMYDMLLEKNQAVTDVFLLNIDDHLSAFCVQLDANSNRIIQAKGQGYTAIQAQSVNPSVENFTQIYYKIAGNAAERLNFSSSFGGNYTQYLCGVDLMCFHVCLASASISSVALSVNSDFQSHFFSPGSTPTLNQSASDLYQISLLNPQTGDPISSLPIGIILYSVYIPLKNFTPSAYYGCFIYSSNAWDVKFCSADLYPVMFDDDVRSLRCSCIQPGMLGVFQVDPPNPSPVPEHNEIQLSFSAAELYIQQVMSSVKMEDFVSLLAQLSSTDVRRFRAPVKCPSPMNCLNVTLRPPFLESHLSNSYTIQSISRVVNQEMLKASSSSQAIISSFNYTVVQRNLTGDGHARKVIMDIESLYQAVVGDNSSHLETKWAESIASTLRIDIRRIKKPSVARGIIYNFTVTLPFEEEPALSAEEITLMLLESTKYGELTLLGEKGQPVNISPLTYDNLVELQVIKETNALVIVLSIVISTTLVIFLLFLSGAVLVKIRTDRVIEEQRSRALLGANPPPSFSESTSQSHSQSPSQYPHEVVANQRHRNHQTRHY